MTNERSPRSIELAGKRCLVLGDGGPRLRNSGGARDIVEAALNERASVVVVPASRLDAAFFDLRSGFAGEVLQKAANYRLTLAIIGDVSAHIEASAPFRDFVIESNRGDSVFFEPDIDALTKRLESGWSPVPPSLRSAPPPNPDGDGAR